MLAPEALVRIQSMHGVVVSEVARWGCTHHERGVKTPTYPLKDEAAPRHAKRGRTSARVNHREPVTTACTVSVVRLHDSDSPELRRRWTMGGSSLFWIGFLNGAVVATVVLVLVVLFTQ